MSNKFREGFSQQLDAGLNLMQWTQEQTEKFVSKLVEQGKANREEAQTFAKELFEQIGTNHRNLHEMIKEAVGGAVGNWKVVSQSQFDELNRKVEELTKKLEGDKQE